AFLKTMVLKGLPPLMVKYIISEYAKSTTITCDVSQKDPMSHMLFGFVIDGVFRRAPKEMGVKPLAVKAMGHQTEVAGDQHCTFALLHPAPIPTLKRRDPYRYLGISFKAEGRLNISVCSKVKEKP
ncbi:hypothetical protein GWI33_014277, partial [Rhynchophorus ferrugineus]